VKKPSAMMSGMFEGRVASRSSATAAIDIPPTGIQCASPVRPSSRLASIAAVSLIVGGIGIMNIMLVSVTERTREIGIRLAIGATEGEVLLQFLVEAVMLSLFGGVAGILVGVGAAAAGASLLKVPFVFNAWIVAVSFLFSGAVGVIFGFFPARKAAQLNPIDALRHE